MFEAKLNIRVGRHSRPYVSLHVIVGITQINWLSLKTFNLSVLCACRFCFPGIKFNFFILKWQS